MAFLDETGLAYFWNQILARLNKFVPAESGKGLSSNDYTVEEKEKLAGIEVGANKIVVDSTLNASSTNPVQNKAVQAALDIKYEKPSGGIPKSDFTSDVQASLGKADTAIQSLSGYATETYVDNKVAGLVDSAPATLDTLNELAAALGDDPNFATTVTNQIGGKVDKIDGKGLSTNDYTTAEKEKLAGIATGANNYVLPVATSSTIGGVKSGTDITIDSSGNVSVNDDSHNHIIGNVDGLQDALDNKVNVENGQYAITTAGDGAAYTATVPGITSLTAGVSFIMIPHVVSTSTIPTLNVNGLGAKNIKRRLTSLATAAQPGYTAAWLANGLPFRVIYDGTQWVVEGHDKPAGADIYGAAAKATADADGNVITDTYATITALQDLLPKVKTITLGTTWEGTGPYYQDVELSYVTAEHMVDLQPTVEQIISWKESGYAFTTFSGTGSVRVYAIGNLPTESISVQTRAQKVSIVS